MGARPATAGAVGIGLRSPHYAELLERRPALAFLEVHSENFFAEGGASIAWLERFRSVYPLSLHGVGLSLGSADGIDERHVAKLERLVRRVEPRFVSEHLSWSAIGGRHSNDLLPLPYTEEALALVVERVDTLQERLSRPVMLENISTYHAFAESTLPEWEFVAEVARRSGCMLLLDLNNIHVNAANHGFDARAYLAAIDPASVGEIHLAGHEEGDGCLIDTHGKPVSPAVWSLYEAAVRRFGEQPTLIEWDTDIPALDVLLGEAHRAEAILSSRVHIAAQAAS